MPAEQTVPTTPSGMTATDATTVAATLRDYPVPGSYSTARPVRDTRRGRGYRSRLRRFVGAVFALLLLAAVPVVSAYVSYKLASGENPFEWPPTVDLRNVF